MRIGVIMVTIVEALTCLCAAAPARAGYTFTNIVDNSESFFDFNSPSINANGQVAFRASLDNGAHGIYRSDGGSITTIAETGAVFQGFQYQTPGIDAQGNIAFMALRRGEAGGGEGIFIGDGGGITIYALTPTTTSPQPGDFAGFTSTVMNSEGTPAFIAAFVGGPNEGIRGGVFLGTSLIADDRGPFASFGDSLGRGLDVNKHGVVVFKAHLDDNNSGIFVHGPGGVTVVADTNGPFVGFTSSVPAINDAGELVFWAEPTPFVSAIYTASVGGGQPEVFVDASGPYVSFGVAPSINESGEIAFTARLDVVAQGNGIFTGPNAAGDKVIFAGDPLFGSVFGGAFISNASINDFGQIAFRYDLADGRTGIAVATPIPACDSADFDSDCDVDGDDFEIFKTCAAGPSLPYAPGCTLPADGNGRIGADFDQDGDTDGKDFALFQRCLSGAGIPADPNCATPPCPLGQVRCDGVCTDTSGDPFNCGLCGVQCPPDAICINGTCEFGGGGG